MGLAAGRSFESARAPLATVVSAVLYGLAFPPFSLAPLAFVALVPLLVAIARGSLRRAVVLSLLWSLIAAWLVGSWFPRAVGDYFAQPLALTALLWLAVAVTMGVPYWAFAALGMRRLARRSALAQPLLAAAVWTGAELARGRLLAGTDPVVANPWSLLGYAVVPTDSDASGAANEAALAIAQVASLGGIYALSFAAASVNAGLAAVALAWREPARRSGSLRALGVAVAPLVVAAAYGVFALRDDGTGPADARAVAVLVQADVDVGSQWREDAYGEHLDLYLRLSESALDEVDADMVFWPESAMTFFVERDEVHRRAIAARLGVRGVELLAGGPRLMGDEASPRFTNSVYLVHPADGRVSARYDKQRLLPFAESFPLAIDLLRRRFGRVREFSRGDERAPLPTRAGAAGLLVCHEIMYPELAAERVGAGAQLLVNPSNDSWIDAPAVTGQLLAMARVRAIEQGRWLLRVSTSGPSALIDPRGRVSARTPANERAVLAGPVWRRDGLTPYARSGDAFALLCAVAGGVALLRRAPDAPAR